MRNLDCHFFEASKTTSGIDVFQFPSEMTAFVSDTQILWQNSIPGMITDKMNNF